MNKESFEQEL